MNVNLRYRPALGRTLAVGFAVGTLLTVSACADDDLAGDDNGGGGGEQISIASQSWDEPALVTAMYEVLLEHNDYEVDATLVDTRDAYMRDFPGNIDIVPEYLAGIGDFLNSQADGDTAQPITTSDPQESLEAIQPLVDDAGITLLDASPATSQNAYFVTEAYSQANGVTALSDLEGESVVLAAAPDCEGRDDCEKGLREVYGIDITDVLPLGWATPDTYDAVLNGEAEVGQTGTLDGTLDDQGLVLLEDDRGIQPAQNLIPAVSAEFIGDHEDVQVLLNDLMAALDNQILGELIARVTVDREKAEDVATDFLTEAGLIN